MGSYHCPVLLEAVLDWLAVEAGDVIVDMTFGGGGYSQAILDRLGNEGKLIAFDRDKDAVEQASLRFDEEERFYLHHSNFSLVEGFLKLHAPLGHDGAVLDLGVSSFQLDSAHRGFSFRQDGPLDMRMDTSKPTPTAADLVNSLSARELADIFWKYGQERRARGVAQAIVDRRREKPFGSTTDLAEVISKVVGHGARRTGPKVVSKKHPATLCFQALRIAVNDELGELERGLRSAIKTARQGARVVVVSYHSLEDGLVKSIFRDAAGLCRCPRGLPVCRCGAEKTVRILTRKPVSPSSDETQRNRRARSARLRVVEKV